VQFESYQQLNHTFWQLHSFAHLSFCLPLLRRSPSNLQPHFLSAQLQKHAFHKTITELMDQLALPLRYWLQVMREAVQLVAALHARGLSLCLPLERCLLIDVRKSAEVGAVCFYFQFFPVLRSQCRRLGAMGAI
jgi:hypothetical protein